MSYEEIIKLILDENNYTVGGGCVCAICGAMASGLMGMVANLSKGKGYELSDEEYDSIIEELNDLKNELLEGSIEDNKAYNSIVNAYKLPKTTDEEKSLRKLEIEKAGIYASKIPLKNSINNKKVNKIGLKLLKSSNPSCLSDLQAGIRLSEIGIKIGKDNILVNLPMIKNEKIREELLNEIEKYNL